MSATNHNALCQSCSKVPFDPKNPPFGNNLERLRSWTRNEIDFDLGTLRDIRRRSCPLCKLVSHAALVAELTEHKLLGPLTESTRLGITWFESQEATSPGPRFALSYNYKQAKGTCLAFIGNTQSKPDTHKSKQDPFWFRPVIDNTLDFKRILGWIRSCEIHHPKCSLKLNPRPNHEHDQRPWPFPRVKLMRFIDIDNGCIVEKTSACRYIALSYVWGTVSSLRLSKSNKARLVQPGSIRGAWRLLSRTVKDAMFVTEELQERYLWVDSLCLVQNDPDDLRAGTDVMDLVYEHSVLTIIAACGRDSDHGIPGVRPGSRAAPSHIGEILPGLQLSVYTAPEYLMRPTVYSSRAWTLQEEKLSTRALYFINDQVYFRCQSRIQPENCVDNIVLLSIPEWINMPRVLAAAGATASIFEHMQDYMQTVQNYSARALTYQNDAYNALRGILRRFESEMGCSFVGGLPAVNLEAFLCFTAAKASLRRRKGFPSYSWSGWIGQIKLSTEMMDRTKLGSGGYKFSGHKWIRWYHTDNDLHIKALKTKQATEQFPIPRGLSLPPNLPTTPLALGSFPENNTAPTHQTKIPKMKPPSIPQYEMLAFWTLSVFIGLGAVDLGCNGELMDRNNRICGRLSLDNHDDTEFFAENGIEGKPALELILLSFGYGRELALFDYDPLRFDPDEQDGCFLVMCIERLQGTGPYGATLHYVERRGIGVIGSAAVRDSFPPGPTWEQITLA
ncbi:heterokaryon incompatibility protein-domain-containing protein [Cladorrhinum sp. PSN259]|nr:heterokaryon incompatibility protein-domain-containing protein [Cladorrhinum sp. PSN259]